MVQMVYCVAYMDLGEIIYLTALRLLKVVQQHDIELVHKYLGTRLSFVSKVLGIIIVVAKIKHRRGS